MSIEGKRGSWDYNKLSRRGQVTIFVIIAGVIVLGIAVFFAVRSGIGTGGISSELRPVFSFYESCIERESRRAIQLAGSQGGHVEELQYEPGSEYAPFSSQLNFLGFPVPYWFYVSGNGVAKEQVPSLSEIEEGVGSFVEQNLERCNFDLYYQQGYEINVGEPEAIVEIEDERVSVDVVSDFSVSRGEESARKTEHSVELNSKLGKFYGIAREIYDKQRNEGVFETYGVDVLRLYAPVDGVEIGCSGKIWRTRNVTNEIKSGLEANIASLKFEGNYYELDEKEDEYYLIDLGMDVDENVNLIYSRKMPTKIEISGEGVDDELMVAEVVGDEQGLGVLGFCYSPYHFVYDISFPVLVQVYDGEEVFQFPVVAVIDNNAVREVELGNLDLEYLNSEEEFDLCEFKNQDIEVNLFDTNLRPVDGEISYQCFDQRCRLGRSENGRLAGQAPSCLNGYLRVRADGFENKEQLFSSNKESVADFILEREYDVELEVLVNGREVTDEDNVVVSFKKEGGGSVSAVLPEVRNVKLSEGQYEISVYVYGNSEIVIPGDTKVECHEVPRAGILGFLGGSGEECFEIEIPETRVEHALRGGGISEVYILESQIEDEELVLRVSGLPRPESLEELQYNFASFEKGVVFVE